MPGSKENRPAVPLVVLAILDGWGIAPPSRSNAVALAKTPVLDGLFKHYPNSQLMAHGRYVGLLPDQEGNSEAGHMNIGAGRIVRQDIVYVSEAIKDRTFFKNTALKEVIKHAQKYGTKVHLMGLMSDGNSAHSCPEHLYAMLQLCHDEGADQVRLHLFTDGRDSPPFSATRILHEVEKHLFPNQLISSVTGRFYAMDRNKHWHRTELAYNALVSGEGLVADSAHAAILHGYNRGESDEFIMPTVIVDGQKHPIGTIDENDVIIYFNLRSDRARQLSKTFLQKDFEQKTEHAFKRKKVPENIRFAAMTDFGPDLPHIYTAFPSHDIQYSLTQVLAPVRQFYIAESEKYAHVTYFFNGGYAEPRVGEERMRVPSPFVAHYDAKPEMRSSTIAGEVIRRLKFDLHDFVVINFANLDMVGHTGNLKATIKATEAVDRCLGGLVDIVREKKGHLIVTGDHGNAECKINAETGEVMTEHTANPVPFILVSDKLHKAKVGDGMLADIAPTILDIMGISKPDEMTGFSLIR
jgi:2,3-bisphosphoglycerate-independent phosphoglycerate mutase